MMRFFSANFCCLRSGRPPGRCRGRALEGDGEDAHRPVTIRAEEAPPGRGPLPYAIPPVPVSSQAGIIDTAAPPRSGPARGAFPAYPRFSNLAMDTYRLEHAQLQFPRTPFSRHASLRIFT